MADTPRRSRAQRLIVGLMSGTSVDGIDAALVRISGRAPRLAAEVVHHVEVRWPPALRRRIMAAMAPATTTTQEICGLHAELARHFAGAALRCIREARVRREHVTAVASHGQTVAHLPARRPHRNTRRATLGSTLQLGDPSVIAALTGIPTVGNFRPADMAVGGQGAPLVPWADAALLAHPARTRCVQNIGGIANVTWLPATSSRDAAGVIAFDTGPGNMLIDAAVSLGTNGRHTFDRNGRLAARGTMDYALFRRLQDHPYFSQRPPKSTGREHFGVQLAREILSAGGRLENNVRTLTALTAWSIADAYLQFLPALPDDVILCGGGADNPTLVALLREAFDALRPPTPIAISRIDVWGIPNKAKEAASFALLAAATLDGAVSNVPTVTGASRPVVLGMVCDPRIRR